MTKSDGGKGSDRRPGKGYGDGWDRIFARQEPDKQPDKARIEPDLNRTKSRTKPDKAGHVRTKDID